MVKRCAWCLPLFLFAALAGAAEKNEFRPRPFDWPQWQGQDRTAVSREKGLLQDWPKGGPPLAWKVEDLGGGYSTPSVAAGRIFGMSYRGDDEVVWALEEATGKELWATRIATANRRVQYGEGSRSTPTVDGDVLYALGTDGDLVCLEVAAGKERWHKQLMKKNGQTKGESLEGAPGGWRYAESPLVDGDRLLVTPGGRKATLAALDKKTGETVWTAQVPGGDGAAYSSIVAAEFNGKRQYIQFLSGGVVGLDGSGKFLWRYSRPSAGINCTTPVYHDGRVFAAAAYGKGGGLVQLRAEGAGVKAEEVYFERNYQNHHGGLVLVDGYLYGEGNGRMACIDFKTGKERWRAAEPGKGSVAYADGRLYYRNERGPLFLVEVNPHKYVSHGRFDQPQRSRNNAWPHPVLANGKLYVRDQGLLLCYDVKRR